MKAPAEEFDEFVDKYRVSATFTINTPVLSDAMDLVSAIHMYMQKDDPDDAMDRSECGAAILGILRRCQLQNSSSRRKS